MKIEEIMQSKMTFPKTSIRKANWAKDSRLRKAIEECLRTGEEVFAAEPYDILYHVKPRYPFVEEAMAKTENKSLLKVSVRVYTPAFSLGVRDEGLAEAHVGRDPQQTFPEATGA